MAFVNFRLSVVWRIVLIVLLMAGLLNSLYSTYWVVVPFILLVFTLLAVLELIHYVERTNRDIAGFLEGIRSSDFSKYANRDKRGKTFARLRQAQNMIIDEFQQVRIERESHYFFLQAVVEYLNTGIISFDSAGNIFLVNEAAKNLLHIPHLKNIHSLHSQDPDLCECLVNLRPGNYPLVELEKRGEYLKLSMRATSFTIQGVDHKLISVQNIKNEVENAELKAWEHLIHVLTHEIMNSMTPISSLSSLLKDKAKLLVEKGAGMEDLSNLAEGLTVIERRSFGLTGFVNNYKKLLAVPSPDFRIVSMDELLNRLGLLVHEACVTKGIDLVIKVKPKDLLANLDAALTEQVLLNLVTNSIDALEGLSNPRVEILAGKIKGRIYVTVKDNGRGIEQANLDKIFIPFFTTKKTGSGIGLSFSRQVMRLQKGSLGVYSALGEGAVFTLEFPATDP